MVESLWHERLYRYGLYITYFLFAATWLGLWSKAPKYLKVFETILQLYVAIFLIINFSPVSSKANMNEFTKGIAFGAGLLLLSNYLIKNLMYLQSVFNLNIPINKPSFINSTNTSFADAFLNLRTA